MDWDKRNLIHISLLDRFDFSIRLYTDGFGWRYWRNWLPRYRRLGGRRFAIDFLWVGFIFEDYGR